MAYSIGDTANTTAAKIIAASLATAKNSANQSNVPPTKASTGTSTTNQQQTASDVNNYAHRSENIVPSPDVASSNKRTPQVQFLPNILDDYDVSTYHWKLFITNQDASTTGQVFDTESQIIIAESGVTNLTIDNVVIDSITTPSAESGTGMSTTVKFRIIEPVGAELIDQIFYQSIALGIGNWNVMPFYLQLQFRNRTPETSETDEAKGALSSLKWLWTLKLTDMRANVTVLGTVYDISAIVYNELAQANAYSTIPHTVTLDNLLKFGTAMEQLTKLLNDDQKNRSIDTVSIPDVYKIVVDDKLAGFTITPEDHNTDSQRHDSTVIFNGKNASFPPATSIDKMIDTLLAQTVEAQKLIKGSETPTDDGLSMPALPNQMKKFWRIITESRPLKFDPKQNNYAREFTIFVVQYDIGILDTNITQDSTGPGSIDAERKRLNTYLKNDILKKKYNYIFTGVNDQVIHFDITINNAFASAQARMGGIYHNAAMADQGPVYQKHAEEYESNTKQTQQQIAFQNNASRNSANDQNGSAAERQSAATQTAELPPDYRDRYTRLIEAAKSPDRSAATRDDAPFLTGNEDQDAQLERARLRATTIATPTKDKTTDQNLNFISDIDITSNAARDAYANYVKEIKGVLRPVARKDVMQESQTGQGVVSSSNPGIQKLSSVFSVAMHSNQDVSFAKVKLIIKGDPFWLYPPPVKENDKIFNSLKPKTEAIKWLKQAYYNGTDSVNIAGTDNFIIIRFRTPRIYEADDTGEIGTTTIKDVETLSGVFKVVSLTNKFENGKFTQELDCIMDYQINIVNLMKEIEEDAAGPSAEQEPADLQDNTDLPERYTKEDRLSPAQRETRETNNPGTQITSNTPVAINSVIPGLPPRYI